MARHVCNEDPNAPLVRRIELLNHQEEVLRQGLAKGRFVWIMPLIVLLLLAVSDSYRPISAYVWAILCVASWYWPQRQADFYYNALIEAFHREAPTEDESVSKQEAGVFRSKYHQILMDQFRADGIEFVDRFEAGRLAFDMAAGANPPDTPPPFMFRDFRDDDDPTTPFRVREYYFADQPDCLMLSIIQHAEDSAALLIIQERAYQRPESIQAIASACAHAAENLAKWNANAEGE